MKVNSARNMKRKKKLVI